VRTHADDVCMNINIDMLTNENHSQFYHKQFWGKEISRLFDPIPFPLKRKVRSLCADGLRISPSTRRHTTPSPSIPL
jgi:hypothetical protein